MEEVPRKTEFVSPMSLHSYTTFQLIGPKASEGALPDWILFSPELSAFQEQVVHMFFTNFFTGSEVGQADFRSAGFQTCCVADFQVG
jgi:hypothetical protein